MIGRMITIVALIGALGAMAVGGYIYLAPQQLGRAVEGATWEQLIDPGIVDFFEKPENWPYLDTLTDEQYRVLWNEYEVSVNQVMDGKRIQIPGFMVSLDLSTDRIVDEFVFVPYQGACIHTPPPPPNQTILVKVPGGTKVWDNWEPVEVTGVLTIENIDAGIAQAGYTLLMDSIRHFEYDRSDPDYATDTAVGAHQ